MGNGNPLPSTANSSPGLTVPSPPTSVQVTRTVMEPTTIGVAVPLPASGRLAPDVESTIMFTAYADRDQRSLAVAAAKLTFPFAICGFVKATATLGGVSSKFPHSDTTAKTTSAKIAIATMTRTRIVRTRASCERVGGAG